MCLLNGLKIKNLRFMRISQINVRAELSTMDTFRSAEFHRFRWAHAHANEFLYGVGIFFCAIVGLVRWLVSSDRPVGFTVGDIMVFVVVGVSFSVIPRLGYYLARYIVGLWYQPEHFGTSYRAYRRIEKAQKAVGNQETLNSNF